MDHKLNRLISDTATCKKIYVIGGAYLIRNLELERGNRYSIITKVLDDFTIKTHACATGVFAQVFREFFSNE